MDEHKDAERPKDKTPEEIPLPTPPPVNPPPPPPNPHPEEGDYGSEPKKSSTISDKVMVLATCVIAVGTLVSAGAICLQWREMVSGSDDTTKIANAADQIKIYAGNAKDSAQQFSDTAGLINGNINAAVRKLDAQAEATQRSTAIAQSALYWEQRPWLGVQINQQVGPNSPRIAPGNVAPGIFQVIVRNFGRTPALRWRTECSEYTEYPQPERVPDCDTLRAQKEKNTIDYMGSLHEGKTLVPDQTADLGLSGRVGANGQGHTNARYWVGKIIYFDAIRPNEQRFTNFCLESLGGESYWYLCDFGQEMN
jgi:hypothetical protein